MDPPIVHRAFYQIANPDQIASPYCRLVRRAHMLSRREYKMNKDKYQR